jgi:penicillin amidase
MRWIPAGLLALAAAAAPLAGCDDAAETITDMAVAAGGSGGTGGSGGAGGVDCGDQGDGAEATQTIAGMACGATVRFDANGFLHAQCVTNADCYRIEGYYHAAHRFSQMDIRRKLVLGELSSAATNLLLPTDIRSRQWFADPTTGEHLTVGMINNASPETLAMLEAYSAGVNAWLAEWRAGEAELSDEYNYPLIDQGSIRDWTPHDSAATILALLDSLTNQTGSELLLGARHAALPAGMAHDLYGQATGTLSTVLPAAASKAGPALDRAAWAARKARLEPYQFQLEALSREYPAAHPDDTGRGSNNWIVQGTRTASGNALLSNDPHLGLSNPAVWYVVHLTASQGDLDVAGASFAGLPAIILGQNSHIAWGATTTYFDQADVYLETLSPGGDGVMLDGVEVPFVTREVTIEVSQGDDHVETLRFVPHHGPVLSVDAEAGTAISARWVGHEGGTDINFMNSIRTATSVEEAREAFKVLTTTGQNFVVADRAGSIGWFPYNWLPRRVWASAALSPWLPLPGDGTAEWDGFLGYDELPQAINPAGGALATANNDMSGHLADGDPTNDGQSWFQSFVAFGQRHARIVELLEAQGDTLDRGDMERIMADNSSGLAATVLPLIAVDPATLTERAQRVEALLSSWNFTCPTGFDGVDVGTAEVDPATSQSAVACAAFHTLWYTLRAATFGDELTAAGFEGDLGNQAPMLIALTRPDQLSQSYWDDVATADVVETQADIVAAALDTTAARLAEWLGDDPAGWQWGRLHTLTLRADLFSSAGLTDFDNGPYYNDGGLFTVDVANPSGDPFAGEFYHRSGASMRFACEVMAETGPHCTIQLPGGQRHDRASPHYDDLFQKWLINEPVDLHTDWATLTADETVQFGPAGE